MRRGHSPGRVRGSSQPRLHLRGQARAGDRCAALTNGRRPECQRRTLPHTKSASWSTRPPLPPRLPAPRRTKARSSRPAPREQRRPPAGPAQVQPRPAGPTWPRARRPVSRRRSCASGRRFRPRPPSLLILRPRLRPCVLLRPARAARPSAPQAAPHSPRASIARPPFPGQRLVPAAVGRRPQ